MCEPVSATVIAASFSPAVLGAGAATATASATLPLFGTAAAASAFSWTSALSLTFSGLSTISGMVQQGQQAASQRGIYEYQAAVARNNAILAGRLATRAIEQGEIDRKQARLRARQFASQQKVGFAAHGLVVGQDTPLEFALDTAELGELDELTIQANAEREAVGFRAQGMNFQSSATLASLRAEASRSNYLGTALTGASSLIRDYTISRYLSQRRRIT